MEIMPTLPPGWTVYETPKGRYLLENTNDEYCSWTHPGGNIARNTYTRSQTNFNQEHAFEVISYTWGNDVEITKIHIFDVDRRTNGDLLVRPNLAEALNISVILIGKENFG